MDEIDALIDRLYETVGAERPPSARTSRAARPAERFSLPAAAAYTLEAVAHQLLVAGLAVTATGVVALVLSLFAS